MRILSRSFLVRARVALHPPARASVVLDAADGRWPEHEAADRHGIGVAMASLAAWKTIDRRWPALEAGLRTVAEGIAATGGGDLPGGLIPLQGFELPGGPLRVVPWEGPGRSEVEGELVRAPGGIVPRLREAPSSHTPAIELAALATLVALAADATAERRIELAFGIEGVLAWYRDADRGSPARHAFTFAMVHTEERLREIGRTLPQM